MHIISTKLLSKVG